MLRRQVVDLPARVAKEIEADDLEDANAAPRVDVADVAELPERAASRPGLLRHLTQRRRLRALAASDQAFRQRPHAFGLAARANRGHVPATPQAPHQHPARRELALHRLLVTHAAQISGGLAQIPCQTHRCAYT